MEIELNPPMESQIDKESSYIAYGYNEPRIIHNLKHLSKDPICLIDSKGTQAKIQNECSISEEAVGQISINQM